MTQQLESSNFIITSLCNNDPGNRAAPDQKRDLETLAHPMQSQLHAWTFCRYGSFVELFVVVKSLSVLKYPLLPFEKMFHLKAQMIQVFTNRNTNCSCVDHPRHILPCHSEIKLETFPCCALVFQTRVKRSFRKGAPKPSSHGFRCAHQHTV